MSLSSCRLTPAFPPPACCFIAAIILSLLGALTPGEWCLVPFAAAVVFVFSGFALAALSALDTQGR